MPQIEDAGEDGIARLEASHATSHLHHDTRQIAAQRGRKLKPEDGLERSFRNHVVDRDSSRRRGPEREFRPAWALAGSIGERDLIRSAITLEDKCSHVSPCQAVMTAADACAGRPRQMKARAGREAATRLASSRRSFRIPASTRPAGANLRSNRRRLREATGRVSELRARRVGRFQHDVGHDAWRFGSCHHLLHPLAHGRTSLAILIELRSRAPGSSRRTGVFVYAGSMTETRMPRVRSSWSSDSE